METLSIDNTYQNSLSQTNKDSRINYPTYKSFDEFIDTNRLRSLDAYVTRRIQKRIAQNNDTFFLNVHRLDEASPYQPGVREIWLSLTKPGTPYDYLDLNRTDLWEVTEAATEFTLLMDFIATLPFEKTGRMLIIYDDSGTEVPAHRDHEDTEVCHDFIWFRTNRNKPFYVLNHLTNQKLYIDSYSAWFDTVNQYHGSDAAPGLSFSIRVDGVFTDEFKRRIPKPSSNLASTPSLWASLGEAQE